MPPGSSSRSSKPKPSEVAAQTKRTTIPYIRKHYANTWPLYSYLFANPLGFTPDQFPQRPLGLANPNFWIHTDDPVDLATNWSARNNNTRVAFICAANEKRPGGDWETGVVGYEERLCRRSSLSATIATPGPASYVTGSHYPLHWAAGIYSDRVVVFRGPHDRYEERKTEDWRALPVVSVTPISRPKLKDGGTRYSFDEEREMAKNKLRVALSICAYNDIRNVVIGDFGLGNCYRNPPQEMAELWREVFLWDTNLRGRIENVAFVFEDPTQSTMRLILEDAAKKNKSGGSSGGGAGKGKSRSSGSSSVPACPTDLAVFEHVFNPAEIQRVTQQPDGRMGLGNLVC
ncbi:hypothetical protein J7T55_009991 [Diaporthe amygdali]|uniref:uncharacterized protein n=1 Tax=Phomopsis amygdali TaxID=1214568 RepID=UPI0022FE7018|nr:uncharacterized protein J7T55_009991 [Diaporthe amygdali]KAJ0116840.1 hypothetical protein J7T55_009991 [Diaporthe amygdali]